MYAQVEKSGNVRSLWHRNSRAIISAVVVTVVVEVGAYIIFRIIPSAVGSVVPALLVSLLWILISSPIFSAGGGTLLDGLIRGGAVADATGVLLIILAVAQKEVTVMGAVKIYLIVCSIVVLESLVVRLGRGGNSRHILAGVIILLMVAVTAGPFWTNGIILSVPRGQGQRIAFFVRAANPVFATTDCLAGQQGFVWNERPVLYDYSVLGRDVPSQPVPWYITCAIYLGLTGAVGVIAAWRTWRGTYRPLGG